MASVSSLDQDMKRLRMSRYTPSAANEVRAWIEESLGESMPNGDLLDVLKDGTILCRLVNLASPGSVKFKQSSMPFIQMENISHFLRACEAPPFNLPSHDRFLTVDLYESKDPAQVLQCIASFSRVANQLYPTRFRSTIGPKRNGTAMSPTHTGGSNGEYPNRLPPIRQSPVTARSSPIVPSKPSNTLNERGSILYAGYMGGASQGNQGISFGARRQITTAAPHVPSLAEKERLRREKETNDAIAREQQGEDERRRRRELEQEEERAKLDEQRRWEEETRRAREEERLKVERQKREWEEQERKWKEEEERRAREESDVLVGSRDRASSNAQLKGQYLSEYQAEQKVKSRQVSYTHPERVAERERIQDLERQLELAKEREKQYEEERLRRNGAPSPIKTRPIADERPVSPPDSNVSWSADDREVLRNQRTVSLNQPTPQPHQNQHQHQHQHQHPPAPFVEDEVTTPIAEPLVRPAPITKQSSGGRPLPQPTPTQYNSTQPAAAAAAAQFPAPQPVATQHNPATPSRPLPNPSNFSQPSVASSAYSSPPPLASSPISPPSSRPNPFARPVRQSQPHPTSPSAASTTSNTTTTTSYTANTAATSNTGNSRTSWAASSFLERERERERQRQQEWEAAQAELSKAPRDMQEGSKPGQTWDVNQYGYTGGDGQNRGDQGIGMGGRRGIIGPRPRP